MFKYLVKTYPKSTQAIIIIITGVTCFYAGFVLRDTDLPLNSQQSLQDISDVKLIEGTFGKLEVYVPESPDEYLKTIKLNGKVILSHDHVGFSLVYPSLSKPQIVVAWSDCGGSACGRPSATLIDLTTDPAFIDTIDELSPYDLKITKNKNTFMLSGGSAYLTNEYGDLIDMRLSYDQQAKELWFSSQHSDIFQKYIGQHPQDLLSDKDAREIFLTLMSPEEFKTFRHNISTASGIYSRNHGRYIIATGMAPHSGGDPAAFFIVDTIYYQFTVGLYHDGYMRLISSMRENGELTIGGDILDEILENYNMVWDFENQKPRKKGQP